MSRTVTLIQTAEPMPALNEMAFERLAQDTNELVLRQAQHESAVRAVALQVGYLLPADCTDPDLIQRDISANMRRSVEACLEVGKGLTVLKTACHHGEFVARLDVLGIDRFVAARFSQAAIKFSNVPTSAHLTKAIGNQSKLFEMLVLDDGQIEELELTGQTGDLKLDEIATMSVKELRKALHESRAEKDAVEKVNSDKDAAMNKMRTQLKRIQTAAPDDVLVDLHKEMAAHSTASIDLLKGSVRAGFNALAEHHASHGGDSNQVMAGYVAQLQQQLNELRDDFNLPNTAGDGTPEWQRWADAKDATATTNAGDAANH